MDRPRILVCSDFSKASDRALKTAGVLSRATQGKIFLLHVAQLPWFMIPSEAGLISEKMSAQYTDFITENCQLHFKSQSERCGVDAEFVLHFDVSVYHSVKKSIEETGASMVIASDKGAHAEEHFSSGSFLRKIPAVSPVPVLIVKNERAIGSIAGLIDVREDHSDVIEQASLLSTLLTSKLQFISLLSSLPGLYQDESTFGHARPVLEAIALENEKQLEIIRGRISDQLKGTEANVLVKTSFESNIGLHLVELLEDGHVDLAVMKRHKKFSLERFLMGSVTNTVIENFNGNVLVL